MIYKVPSNPNLSIISVMYIWLWIYLWWLVYISLAAVYKIRDIEMAVVKQKSFTMLTGTFEKKWKENEVWQLRGWSEDLVGFPHNVLSAADCRADGKELDFKQCTNYKIEEIVSLPYYLKTVYKEQLCLGPVIWQELACNCSRVSHGKHSKEDSLFFHSLADKANTFAVTS